MTEHHLQEDTHSRQPSLPPLELGNLSINPSSPITAEPIRPQEAAQEAQRERVNGNAPNAEEDTETGPHIQFVLLLASAGTRHPFQLNERYLTKRNVNAMDINGNFDPSMISVYNLKELIFKDWRDGQYQYGSTIMLC
ncbi:hypothetical protein ANO11243_066190 [Dothideomycetidae sp. 11243]|nr:hypothetical protein ANO11243_066190 [fungal sp. No.11243]